ncbi:IS3 family transposase [Xenorhabdus bovienii]|uniref:IS3 family transposase n=1 Tax=Xenorhabdus bovienii TaxID=40576 RepID=UPI0008FF9C72|nr:IS3 family transposase [Xenorhabdus bovienii]
MSIFRYHQTCSSLRDPHSGSASDGSKAALRLGSRTLSHWLTNEGQPVGRWKARRLMQECGLQSCQQGAHRYRPAGEEHATSPHLLRQHFTPECPNIQ